MTAAADQKRKAIAVFYYVVVRDNGIGKVNRLRLEHLCEKYDFTVFAKNFDNPRPDRIRWVRVPCILRPGLLATITFWLSAPPIYLWQRFVARQRFDIVQASDAAFGPVDVADAHFCHRHYLPTMFSETVFTRPRELAALLARCLNSFAERRVYRKAGIVVVPSAGLKRELAGTHDINPEKIKVMYPPVSTPIRPPEPGERDEARKSVGIAATEIALLLVALGDFQRKGLMPLIEALADPRLGVARLLVVGGTPPAVYRERAVAIGVSERVTFCGRHDDIRPFFWAADAFVLPSRYEVFPAVTIEAAAGALPIIATRINGVEEYAVDGLTGFTIADCNAAAIADAIARFVALPGPARQQMGCHAREAVQCYRLDRFLKSWDDLYSQFAG